MKKFFQLLALVVVLTTSPLLYGALDMQEIEMDAACKAFVDAVGDRPVAHFEVGVQESILKLHELYPDHRWSALFLGLLQDIQDGGNVIVHQQMVDVVKECLDFCAQELEKNLSYAHEIGVIQSYLLDYQQFLSSAKSHIDVNSALLSKGRSCCVRPCSNALKCFELKSLLVNGNDVLPFLPTGPIPPVEINNYFYATSRADSSIIIPSTFINVAFEIPGLNDGNWIVSGGGTTFTATVSGVFLVNMTVVYDVLSDDTTDIDLILSSLLNNIAIDNATTTFQYLPQAVGQGSFSQTIFMNSTFIISVNQGDILTVVNRAPFFAIPNYFTRAFYLVTDPGWNNGSISIVRLR